MHVAVSGASGFIGRRVVHSLLARGCHVTSPQDGVRGLEFAPLRSTWTQARLVPASAVEHLRLSSAVCGDESPKTLVHLAWANVQDVNSLSHREAVSGHAMFVRRAIEAGVSHIVGVGSCFEYGLREGRLTEDCPVRPVTPYAEAKARLHESLEALASDAGASLTWLRPFYVYGHGQPPTTLWGQLHAAIERGDVEFPMSLGEQTRDYLPVGQMGELIAEVSTREPRDHTVLNVCSGEGVRVLDLVRSWISAAGSPIKPKPGALSYSTQEPLHAYGSTERLHDHLRLAAVCASPVADQAGAREHDESTS